MLGLCFGALAVEDLGHASSTEHAIRRDRVALRPPLAEPKVVEFFSWKRLIDRRETLWKLTFRPVGRVKSNPSMGVGILRFLRLMTQSRRGGMPSE